MLGLSAGFALTVFLLSKRVSGQHTEAICRPTYSWVRTASTQVWRVLTHLVRRWLTRLGKAHVLWRRTCGYRVRVLEVCNERHCGLLVNLTSTIQIGTSRLWTIPRKHTSAPQLTEQMTAHARPSCSTSWTRVRTVKEVQCRRKCVPS